MKKFLPCIILFTIVFLSRLPFLDSGFGSDPDAWRVVSVASKISLHHQYFASRLPGYPVQEILYSFIPPNPIFFNGITAFLISLSTFFFALILQRLHIKNYFLASLAFAFTPIIYINSITAMDYVWALAFILASIYCLFHNRILFSAVLLGIATGCRSTSILMLIPLGIILYNIENKKLSKVIQFWSITSIVGFLCFVPVIKKYGIKFFAVHYSTNLPILQIFSMISLEIWGVLGVIGFLCVFFSIRKNTISYSLWNTISLCVIVVYSLLFLLLPYEAGYLIPIVPFVIIVIQYFVRPKFFILFCYFLILSSFIINISVVDRPWHVQPSKLSVLFTMNSRKFVVDIYGPIICSYLQRKQEISFTKNILLTGKKLEQPSVVVVGVWMPKVVFFAGKVLPEDTEPYFSFEDGITTYIDVLDAENLSFYKNKGYKIFYLQSQERYNYNVTGVQLKENGGGMLVIE